MERADVNPNVAVLVKCTLNRPTGFVAVPLKGAVLVIPARVYAAGLTLGETLRRREAKERWWL